MSASVDMTVRIYSTDEILESIQRNNESNNSGNNNNNNNTGLEHSKIIRGLCYCPATHMIATGSWDRTSKGSIIYPLSIP